MKNLPITYVPVPLQSQAINFAILNYFIQILHILLHSPLFLFNKSNILHPVLTFLFSAHSSFWVSCRTTFPSFSPLPPRVYPGPVLPRATLGRGPLA